jgi:hypothetical protein
MLKQFSIYAGKSFMLTTKHAKSIAIAPPFLDILDASVIEYIEDTDMLGTFSGEIKRQGNALECAKKNVSGRLINLILKLNFH